MGIYQRPGRQVDITFVLQLAPVILLVIWVASVWVRSI
jgi:hypothetical protein